MLTKNGIYEALVTDYTAEGQGVAHVEGCAVFIPNAIAGERYRIKIGKAGKTWASGVIQEILERSPHRVSRACPQGKLCGGCDFQHMDYEEELRLKALRVRTNLNRLGGESLDEVKILGAPALTGYRNKAQYPVTAQKGRAVAGFYRAGTHQVVSTPRCGILPVEMDLARDVVLDYVNQVRLSVYDEETHRGLLRHIYVRKGWVTGQVMVCLVVNGDSIPRANQLVSMLRAKVPGFATLVLSVNKKPGNAVLGAECKTLYGPGYMEDVLCGLTFRLSPRSFYQVNHDQAERLYALAIEKAALTKMDTVLDLYCGVGTITLAMAKAAGKAIGVEIVPEAIADAKENAARNGVQNAEFFCADAGQAALSLEERGLRPDVIVVDPPRKGLSRDAIEAIAKLSPDRLVYVSCDCATLARDVALLKGYGFRLQSADALDLFPRCAHVETVVTLSRKTPDDVIEIDLDLDELDITAAESKATYDEIKAYVKDKYHLNVNNLYIAQVKRKLGLDVGQNYNLPKSEDARPQPQCPPEKEAAILDALRHFGML